MSTKSKHYILQNEGLIFVLFADFLNYAMKMANISNYKLAKELGVSQSTIANWANGETEPREKRKAQVLDLFGVDKHGLEEGFPEIHYAGESGQKETPTSPEADGELNEEEIKRRLRTLPRETLLDIIAEVTDILKEK